jgi:predicted flap endonuclease-1-like 5' DNA nuclease
MDQTKPQICGERLCLTADKRALVRAKDPRANTLYATPGTEIPASAVARFGLVDGKIPEGQDVAPADYEPDAKGKAADTPENKAADTPQDKQITLGQNKAAAQDEGKPAAPELTDVTGVGKATADKLIAGGIAGVAGLAAVNPETPPTIEGLQATFDWVKAVASAKELAAKGGVA